MTSILKWALLALVVYVVYRWVAARTTVTVEAAATPPADPLGEATWGSGIAGGLVPSSPQAVVPVAPGPPVAPVLVFRPGRKSSVGATGSIRAAIRETWYGPPAGGSDIQAPPQQAPAAGRRNVTDWFRPGP